VNRESAESLLERGGQVKTAIVMQKCGCSRDAAEEYLSVAGGFVSEAIVIGMSKRDNDIEV
jgi:N-acetylmuramic acid 6-phosphate (MurNAc-6-P) etherase